MTRGQKQKEDRNGKKRSQQRGNIQKDSEIECVKEILLHYEANVITKFRLK